MNDNAMRAAILNYAAAYHRLAMYGENVTEVEVAEKAMIDAISLQSGAPAGEPVAWAVFDKNGKRLFVDGLREICDRYVANSDAHPLGPFTVEPLGYLSSRSSPPTETK